MARDWDSYWLARAKLNATMSTCCTRKVGAVAVKDRRSFADGFNGNLPGQRHCDEGGCARCANAQPGAELDSCVCVHAEQNIVSYCARRGISLDGAAVYCTTQPCLECTKLLVVSGIIAVIYDENYPKNGSFLMPGHFMRQYASARG